MALGTDNSMNEGYKFPCCQLIVPKVCCNMIYTIKDCPQWKYKYYVVILPQLQILLQTCELEYTGRDHGQTELASA